MTDEESAYDALSSVRNGDLAALELLLSTNPKIARIAARGCGGRTLLQYAVSDGHTHIVTKLLAFGANPEAQDNRGFSALHAAAYCGRTELLDLLLKQGAGCNIQDEGGLAPIHFAAAEGHTDAVKILLAQPFVDVNIRDLRRKTPLHFAASHCQVGTARVLLDQGADVNAVADDGGTPLDWAWFRENNKDVIALLQRLGGRLRNTKG